MGKLKKKVELSSAQKQALEERAHKVGAKAMKEEAVASKMTKKATAAKKAADKMTAAAHKAAAAAKDAAQQVGKVAKMDHTHLATAVRRATKVKHETQQALKHALAEQKFAH